MNSRKIIFAGIIFSYSSFFIPSLAMKKLDKPTIILTGWKNKTPHTINFFKGNFLNKTTDLITSLNADEEAGIGELSLDNMLEQYSSNNERIGHVNIIQSDDDKAPYLKLLVQHLPSDKKIFLKLLQIINREQRKEICSREIDLRDSMSSIEISGIVKGDQFEYSKMSTCINAEEIIIDK